MLALVAQSAARCQSTRDDFRGESAAKTAFDDARVEGIRPRSAFIAQ
jgi:hypothetical protein